MNTNEKRIALLGVPVDNLNMDKAVNRIFSMINGYAFDRRAKHVVTANVDFLVKANKKDTESRELMSILRKADMVTADGMPLVWLSKFLGRPLEERVTGADLVPALAAAAAERGRRIYFLGGKPGAAEKTVSILKEKHPELQVAGYSAPFVKTEFANEADKAENDRLVKEINESGAHILLIALGNPKQEIWFNRNRKALNVPVSIGVGGTFEFIAGMTSRAPLWVQRSGFEWVYRTLQEPRRMVKRYVEDLFSFGMMITPLITMNTVLGMGRTGSRSGRSDFAVAGAGANALTEAEALDLKMAYRDILTYMATRGSDVVIDLHQRTSFSPDELADLIEMVNKAESEGVKTRIVGANSMTRMALKINKLDDLFETENDGPVADNTYRLQTAA